MPLPFMLTRIPTDCRSSMRCAWCAAACRPRPRFPPRQQQRLYEAVLAELLADQLPPRRLRRWPRAVKRKMSNFPLRRRGDPPLTAFDPEDVIRIVK